MILIFLSLFVLLFTAFSYSKIIAEIIFLKTQLSIVKSQNKIKSYKTNIFQKLSLSFLFTFLHHPKHLCYIFTPETILKWYKDITKKFWTFKNKNKKGRPAIPPDTKQLIIQMKKDNPKWGYKRIHGELKKLNISVSKTSISTILIQNNLNPTGTTPSKWSTFIKSHVKSITATDFKLVTSIFGIRFYIMFFISYHSRRIIHYNVTTHPTKKWIENQLRHISDGEKKIYLIRDNDMLFKYVNFKIFDIKDIPIAIQCPNMNPIIERFIGSFNREALNNFVIINENQLRNISKEYVSYYNTYRPHQGIENITIPAFESNEIKVYTKAPVERVKKKEILSGILNHYYYENSA